jgi:hypothetical protein
MAAGAGDPVTGGKRATMRAADADRDRVAGILGLAYSEGRLSQGEYDARLETAFSARTYADLDQIVADLPGQAVTARPAAGPASAARTNGLAMASLACGLGQFIVGPLATIPAIALGHVARSQIRRTGDQGAGLALAGLVLGWGAVVFAVIVALLFIAVGAHSAMPAPAPGP